MQCSMSFDNVFRNYVTEKNFRHACRCLISINEYDNEEKQKYFVVVVVLNIPTPNVGDVTFLFSMINMVMMNVVMRGSCPRGSHLCSFLKESLCFVFFFYYLTKLFEILLLNNGTNFSQLNWKGWQANEIFIYKTTKIIINYFSSIQGCQRHHELLQRHQIANSCQLQWGSFWHFRQDLRPTFGGPEQKYCC